MAVGYRAVLTVAPKDDSLKIARENVQAWLRDKLQRAPRGAADSADTLDFTQSFDEQLGRGLRIINTPVDRGDGRTEQIMRLDDSSSGHTWRVTITAHREVTPTHRKQSIMVEVDPQHLGTDAAVMEAGVPRFVRSMLKKHLLRSGETILTAEPKVLTGIMGGREAFKAIMDSDRGVQVVVAQQPGGTDPAIWCDVVASLTRNAVGLMVAFTLDEAAAEELNRRLPAALQLSAGDVRTFMPYVDLDDPSDSLRHRNLGPETFARHIGVQHKEDKAIPRVDDTFASVHARRVRVHALEQRLPSALRDAQLVLRSSELRAARERAATRPLTQPRPGTATTSRPPLRPGHPAGRPMPGSRPAPAPRPAPTPVLTPPQPKPPAPVRSAPTSAPPAVPAPKPTPRPAPPATRPAAPTAAPTPEAVPVRPVAPTTPPTPQPTPVSPVPAPAWQENLVALLSRVLDVDEITPEAIELLGEQLDAAERRETEAEAQIEDALAQIAVAEFERDAVKDQLEDAQLAEAAAEEERRELARDVAHLRQKAIEAERYEDLVLPELTHELAVPASFEELVQRLNSPDYTVSDFITFTGDTKKMNELGSRDHLGKFVGNAWDAVLALDGYARACKGGFNGGFDDYIKNGKVNGAKVAPKKHVSTESESVQNNRSWAAERLLPVPISADSSGHKYMWAHFRISNGNTYPRMHYYDDLANTGKIYIGYIGKHLPNTKTN